MKTAPPRLSAASVRASRPLRRKVLRMEISVGRDGPRRSRRTRSSRLRPKRSLMPVRARGPRATVTRTPRQTGTSAASSGTSSPIADLEGEDLRGGIAELGHVEVREAGREDREAPRPERAERQRDAGAPATRRRAPVPRYRPAIWSFRAPIAFMTPIWRVCWARIAAIVFTTRNPDTMSDSAPMTPEDEEEALEQLVGRVLARRRHVGRRRPARPARSSRSRTSSATRADPVAVQRRVVDEDAQLVVGGRRQPRSASVSEATWAWIRPV